MDLSKTLTDDHCDCINNALKMYTEATEIAEACGRAGMPMDEAIANCREKKKLAEGMKREFFPHRP